MMGSAIRRSELVFTVSEASRRDILRFYPDADPDRAAGGAQRDRRGASCEDPGEEEMERVRERYQIRGRFVLYAGNIKPHKNLERLIAAFGLLKQRPGHEDVKLLIIGDEVNKYGVAAPQRGGGGRAPGRALLRLRARAARWPRSTGWPPCSPSRRSTRASACRRWRRWPAAPRW